MAPTSKDLVLNKMPQVRATFDRKVTVVGANLTGSSCVNAILCQKIAGEVCLIDKDAAAVSAEVMDFQHVSSFINNAKITGGSGLILIRLNEKFNIQITDTKDCWRENNEISITIADFSLSKDSQVILITIGCRIDPSESKVDHMHRNISQIREIIPKILEHNKNPIIIVATPPCDLTAYLAWKLSGLPKNRVFGLGTALDSTRFSYYLSERVGVAPSECKGWIIGEHGDHCMPVWSSVNIGGVRLRDIYPSMGRKDDKDDWDRVHHRLVDAPYDIIDSKGCPNWSVGLLCAALIHDVFNNTGLVRTISTAVAGQYGIDKNIFLSLPCVLTSDGIKNVVKLPLDAEEVAKLQEAANVIYKKMYQHKL